MRLNFLKFISDKHDLFKPERVERNLIQRGKDFPREDLSMIEPPPFFEDVF